MAEIEGDPEIPDLEDLAKVLGRENSFLMDINHQAVQEIRGKVAKLEKIRGKFNDHMDILVEAHIASAIALTVVAEEIIMAEFEEYIDHGEEDDEEEGYDEESEDEEGDDE